MKTTKLISLLLLATISATAFSQKLDFSVALASVGGVHSTGSVVTDKNGNIFVAAGTREGLRVTEDAFQKSYKGHKTWNAGDVFLMKLSSTGELIYSTYLGGSKDEHCGQMAIDNSGNIYVTFATNSDDLTVSDNAYQKTKHKRNDYCVFKFDNNCQYVASTYLGGSGNDWSPRLMIHNNLLYLFGMTNSKGFPTTKNAIQKQYFELVAPDSSFQQNECDISITALSLDLDRVLYSTYLGGKNIESVSASSFDKKGRIILAGATLSDDYPTSENGYYRSLRGKRDGFLTILSPGLSKIVYSTYFGGSSDEEVNSVAMPDANNIIITGSTKSPDFPVTSDAMQGKFGGGVWDGFILKLNWSSNKLSYSTFIGGSGDDVPSSIGFTDKQKFVLVGTTNSSDFPTTKVAVNSFPYGKKDLSITLLDKALKNIEFSYLLGGSDDEGRPALKFLNGGRLLIQASTKSPDFPVNNRYANSDSTGMHTLMQINLEGK